EDVGRFLLKRLDREMRTLFMTLDQLDRASITAQRADHSFVKEIEAVDKVFIVGCGANALSDLTRS
ncbi:hypothetical protein DMI70_14100, partial [Escherichia coli]|nr:hypothetical protein [Escherichia coli]